MRTIRALIVTISISLMSIMTIDTRAQSPTSMAAMAQEYSASPEILTALKDSGLSPDDMKRALELASEVAEKGTFNVDEAAEQILALKQDGADWINIAKDFDIEIPESF